MHEAFDFFSFLQEPRENKKKKKAEKQNQMLHSLTCPLIFVNNVDGTTQRCIHVVAFVDESDESILMNLEFGGNR